MSLLGLDVESWSEDELNELDEEYIGAFVRERIQQCLLDENTALSVSEIVDKTGVTQRRVEDALEILTRERQVAVKEHASELVFAIEAKHRPELGGERLVVKNGTRVFEVDAVQTEAGINCIKLTEKSVWDGEYEHTVGAVVIPRSALDVVFSMLNVLDERFVYEDETSN